MSLRSSPPAHARVSSNPSFVVSVYAVYAVYSVYSMYSVVKPLASALCAPRSDCGRGPIMASDLPPHATLVWSPRHSQEPHGVGRGACERASATHVLSRGLTSVSSSETGYKNGSDASLVLPPSGLAHADGRLVRPTPVSPSRRDIAPWLGPGER